jgi:hypothetical protein
MVQSSWEANSHSASQEIPRLLWNPKAHYRVHMSPQLIPILSQMNTVHTFPPYFPKIHFNIISHLHLGLLSSLFPSGFPTLFANLRNNILTNLFTYSMV